MSAMALRYGVAIFVWILCAGFFACSFQLKKKVALMISVSFGREP